MGMIPGMVQKVLPEISRFVRGNPDLAVDAAYYLMKGAREQLGEKRYMGMFKGQNDADAVVPHNEAEFVNQVAAEIISQSASYAHGAPIRDPKTEDDAIYLDT